MRKVKLKSYEYIESLSENENQNQLRAREQSEKLGLAAISLSKPEAQILQFLLLNTGPKKVVEIGTLTGLTALYILEVLPEEACLWTLEKSEVHAQWAAEVLAHEIKKNRCKIIIGDAKEKLNELRIEGPFDAVFIDGNKAAYLDYFNWALENIKKDGIIVADNVFLAGAVWGDQTSQKFSEKQVRVVQEMNQLAFTNKNLKSIILPTEEGMLICKKLS
jgi:predicted O-methyltransferase YrrM